MPPVIAGVTFISKKWGNNLGGIVASLPWVAGPIILFIALEQGSNFAASTIPGVMVGIIGWLVFCITYIIIGQKFNALISVLIGYLTYIITGILLQRVSSGFNVNTWFIITLILIIISLYYFPKVPEGTYKPGKKLRFEIPLRMTMITAFVLAITYFADILGPTWSGILTPFPIMTAVLAIFVHYTQGIHQVRKVFIGLYTGIFGFTTFLYLQAHFLPVMSITNSFLIGIAVDLILTFVTVKIISKLKLN